MLAHKSLIKVPCFLMEEEGEKSFLSVSGVLGSRETCLIIIDVKSKPERLGDGCNFLILKPFPRWQLQEIA